MQRHPALQQLSNDHHHSLVIALRCLRAASSGDPQQIRQQCEAARAHSADWETHFQAEEQTLLPLCLALGGETAQLARELMNEHQQLRQLAGQLAHGNGTTLHAFGELLQAHVRQEERGLFPRLQAQLSAAQLAALEQQQQLNLAS